VVVVVVRECANCTLYAGKGSDEHFVRGEHLLPALIRPSPAARLLRSIIPPKLSCVERYRASR
jgi:hypothetical protein